MAARFARAARHRRARGASPAAARVQPCAESLTLPIARRLLRRREPRFARPRGRPRRRALSASASGRCPSSTTRAVRPSGFVRPDVLRPRTPPTARQKSTPPPTAFMRMQTGHPPTHIDCGRQSPTAATFSRNDHSRAAGRTAWANRNLVAAQAACEAKGARSSRGAPQPATPIRLQPINRSGAPFAPRRRRPTAQTPRRLRSARRARPETLSLRDRAPQRSTPGGGELSHPTHQGAGHRRARASLRSPTHILPRPRLVMMGYRPCPV